METDAVLITPDGKRLVATFTFEEEAFEPHNAAADSPVAPTHHPRSVQPHRQPDSGVVTREQQPTWVCGHQRQEETIAGMLTGDLRHFCVACEASLARKKFVRRRKRPAATKSQTDAKEQSRPCVSIVRKPG
jgi:hypothetical protein